LVAGNDVTALLRAWGNGDEAALARLIPLVYDEIHRLARAYMARERPGPALQATALVHEVYLRLVDVEGVDFRNRSHFYALCARLMRRVVIDFARKRDARKRDGRFTHIGLEAAEEVGVPASVELIEVDEALKKLQAVDERKGQVVELRFYGGLTMEEIASVLEVSPETVLRDWRMAKAWLLRELREDDRS
jgi:RNA polymerase sigma factor (TIGR02999 family)